MQLNFCYARKVNMAKVDRFLELFIHGKITYDMFIDMCKLL